MLPTKIYFTSTYHFEILRIDVNKNNSPQQYQATCDFKDPVVHVRIIPLTQRYQPSPAILVYATSVIIIFSVQLLSVLWNQGITALLLWGVGSVHRSNVEHT